MQFYLLFMSCFSLIVWPHLILWPGIDVRLIIVVFQIDRHTKYLGMITFVMILNVASALIAKVRTFKMKRNGNLIMQKNLEFLTFEEFEICWNYVRKIDSKPTTIRFL